jgi:cell division protein FtsW (lipid II flippase)/cell division protein FtsI/penicillin-binding protein 2
VTVRAAWPRGRLVIVELAALGLGIVLVWWLGGRAASAWQLRVGELTDVRRPDAGAVAGLARRADVLFTLGVVVLAAGRVLGVRRAREPAVLPWIVPAAVYACLIGLVIHHATVEVAGGVVAVPSAAGFATGFLLGAIAAAIVMVAPVDLPELASRGQLAIAIVILGSFVALAVAGSGPPGSGTRINLGPVQPIEVIKPLAVVFLAGFLGARAAKLRWQRQRVLRLRWPRLALLAPAIAALVLVFAGLYVVGDLGPVLLLAFIFVGMFFLVTRSTGWIVVALAIVVVILAIAARWPELAGGGTLATRLRMWSDPWANGLAQGHQLGEGLWATAAGGWTGQGLGQAAVPLVPAGKTDLILATTSEQLGALGLVAYQALVAAIAIGGLVVAARERTAVRVLLAGGLALLVLVQWITIQAGTLGQLPLTGIAVPFLSSGKSSMVAFVAMVGMIARLSVDARIRARSDELDELHAAARGALRVAVVVVVIAVVFGVRATALDRIDVASRGIVRRLADGTIVHRMNPRLVALAARIRRGTIADRTGAPLAISARAGERSYPLGTALGTLLGADPARVQLPPWALERAFDVRLRGFPERAGAPGRRAYDPRGPDASLPWPDLRGLAPLLDLDRAQRRARLAAIDADVEARSVRLTIDAGLQTDVAALLSAAVSGKHLAAVAVVLDVDTGQVLARAQVPDLAPGAAEWQDRILANDAADLARFRGAYGAWPDKTGVQGMFQAGSVGKLFTALAAVRAGMVAPVYHCDNADDEGPLFTQPGWHKPIHDHRRDRPHGAVDLVDAIAVSCNVYFAQLGLALGGDPLVALRAAGVDIGYSADAFVPGPPGSRQLASTAFGQGAMVINAMQAARLVAAIAAGGRYRRCPPTMELDAICPETVITDDARGLATIIAGMRRVMTAGTGARLVEPRGLRVYGKTGTADVRGFAGEEPFGIRPAAAAPPHAWFVGFVEPSATPEESVDASGRIAIAVVVPRSGTGASVAGPLAMEILAAVQDRGYLD